MTGALVAAAALGLASIPHCAGMCGPLAAYASAGSRSGAGYHLGRLLAYLGLGAAAGALGEVATGWLPARHASAVLSWTLAAALAVTAWRLWRGRDRAPAEPLVALRRDGRRPVGLAERAMRLLPRRPLSIGLITGALPCGALWTAALLAAGTGDALSGALALGVFGAVSAVGLVAIGAVARAVSRRMDAGRDRRFLASTLAAGLLVGAIVLAIRPIPTLGQPDAPPPCHERALRAR